MIDGKLCVVWDKSNLRKTPTNKWLHTLQVDQPDVKPRHPDWEKPTSSKKRSFEVFNISVRISSDLLLAAYEVDPAATRS